MAHLPLSWKPVKIFPCSALIICCTPSCLYSKGNVSTIDPPLLSSSNEVLAQRCHPGFLPRNLWSTCNGWYSYAPLVRPNACSLVTHSGWQISWCLCQWNHHNLPRWDSMKTFPLFLLLLSGLPWEVSSIISLWYLFRELPMSCRILLMCIKYLGNMPCPQCLINKCDIKDLGTKPDMKRCETRKQVDDDRWRMLVETAREMVYTKGVQPGAKSISNLVQSHSLVPTHVSDLDHLPLIPNL